ncbi:Vesicle-fusing ATPase [Aphelenchoides besseyi]|nr:Vesicle-fusing ATPase [Aphelenchoides besseyi]
MSSHHNLKVCKLSSDQLGATNRVYVNAADINERQVRHIEVITGPARHYYFTLGNDDPTIKPGEIGFSLYQRRWAMLSLEQVVQVLPKLFTPTDKQIVSIEFIAEFSQKKFQTSEPLDSDAMAREFLMQSANMVLSVGQQLIFKYGEKGKVNSLSLVVKSLEGAALNQAPSPIQHGLLNPNASVVFDKAENAVINFIGSSKGKPTFRTLINPEWDFEKMGIGGLDKEFSTIFRRAFASRLYPPEYIEQLAMKHVRGILLYGPPGTGKTLIARQIGKMLNAREPKIVNGPDILNKYVGESEANLRKLFADAEEEWRRCGANSGLHIIIFDELDAICKQRGSSAGGAGVHDTIVNQLLTKLDGVEQLNNMLVIGMTNRKDMIDEALLRPGRLEVQLEISLPDERGRVQILKIHTSRLREFKKLAADVDLPDLARRTKNFSGAEIEGLVRAAQSSAMNRLVKVGSKVEIDPEAIEKFAVDKSDFDHALEHDVKAAFGHSDEQLERLLGRDVIYWDVIVSDILRQGELLVEQTQNQETSGFVQALLTGPANSGKTCLAAKIAKESDFPFIKVVTPEDMVGFSETAKCFAIKKIFEDSYKSPMSIVIVDNLERLLDYSPIGPRYSNMVLQALLVLIGKAPPKKNRLMILATSSNQEFLRQVEMLDLFTRIIHVPKLNTIAQINKVLDECGFSVDETRQLQNLLQRNNYSFRIGIKQLLKLIDNAQQCEKDQRVNHLVNALESLALDLHE